MQRKLQQLMQTGICSLILLGHCLCSHAQGLSFDWVDQIGGNVITSDPNEDAIYALAADDAGNVFITGSFVDTVDFDPGPDIAELSTAKSHKGEAFLAKYDAEGNSLWVIKLADSINYDHNSGALSRTNLTIDPLGNVYIAGSFTGTGDFDPGPGVNQLQLPSFEGNAIFAKYSGEGQCLWVRSLSGIAGKVNSISGIELDNSGHIYLSGMFSDTVDFDPGSGVAQLIEVVTSLTSGNTFLARYDTGGNYQWVRQLSNLIPHSMTLDTSANIYISGSFKDTTDFDPGPGLSNLISPSKTLPSGTVLYRNSLCIAKYNSEGDYLMAGQLGGTQALSNKSQLIFDKEGGLYFYGYYRDSVDCDPGPNAAILYSGGTSIWKFFLAKYDTGLNYEWALTPESIVGGRSSNGKLVLDDRTDNVYIAGSFTRVVDFDPGPGIAELTVTGNPDNFNGFLACYNSCGNYVWAGCTGSAQSGVGVSGLTIKGNALYAGGMFTDTVDINPLPDSVGLIAAGTSDGFLLKMNISRDTLTATGCHGSFSFNDKNYTASGIYFDTLTSSLGCDSFATLNLTIIPNPALTLDNGTLTASDADSYQWLNCEDNTLIAGAAGQTYTPVISGSYAAITTTSGCTDTSECVLVEVTGVDKLGPGNKVLLYPNPTHGILQVQAEQSLQGMDIRLVNAVGQTLAVYTNISDKTYSLDMTAYAAGMYYVEISKNGRALLRKKVTKL